MSHRSAEINSAFDARLPAELQIGRKVEKNKWGERGTETETSEEGQEAVCTSTYKSASSKESAAQMCRASCPLKCTWHLNSCAGPLCAPRISMHCGNIWVNECGCLCEKTSRPPPPKKPPSPYSTCTRTACSHTVELRQLCEEATQQERSQAHLLYQDQGSLIFGRLTLSDKGPFNS